MPSATERLIDCWRRAKAGRLFTLRPPALESRSENALAKAGIELGENGSIFPRPKAKALSRADLARLSSEVSHRRMAECLASNQVLHLDHKLRVTPLYIERA
jgi:hypothetical protein